MDQDNQGNNHGASEIYPVKCRPGHTKRCSRPNVDREENVVASVQNLQLQDNAPILTGFEGIQDNQPREVNENDIAVGQVIHGVIDASFDDGHLITVRVGNSDNTLRGVIFKPGRYVPVAADNDVASNVPMIRRNEVPTPANPLNQVNVHNPGSMDKNEQHVGSYRSRIPKLPVSRARHLPPVPILSPRPLPEDKFVPVILQQPANFSTGGIVAIQTPSVVTLPAPLGASKGKEVVVGASSNASEPTNQVETIGNQVLPSPPSSNQGMPNFDSAEALYCAELNSLKLPCQPSEDTLIEVIKRVQGHSQSDKPQMINNIKFKNNDMDDQPLAVMPLQTVFSDGSRPASQPNPFKKVRTPRTRNTRGYK